jgi:hypothetical protein
MADYYPLIARAVAGLDPGAPGEARRALYERARTALIAQLRSVEPPLTETEITRERLALEEAIRKVESEAAQRARIEPPKPDPLARTRPGDSLRSTVRSRANVPERPGAGNKAGNGELAAGRDRPGRDRSASPVEENQRPAARPPRPEPAQPSSSRPAPPPTAESGGREAARPQQGAAPDARRPRRTDAGGLRGFRDVVADVDDLGNAAAQANRSARRTYANVPSPSPEFDRIEPNMDNRVDPMAEAPYGYDEEPQGRAPAARQAAPKPPGAKKARRLPGLSGFPVKTAMILGIVLVLAGIGALALPKAWPLLRGMMKSQPVAEAPKAPAPSDAGTRPKIADRVGQPGASQIAPVAQKVVLYDEDPSDPKGKSYTGTVVWRTDQIAAANGQPADVAVRADIEVPDRKLKMTLSIRRNTDTSLPASHTAELTFSLPQDFAGGGVANVPVILMKSSEQAKGTPLAGLAVKVTDGFFLIGLSNVDADKSRNIQLLKERSWFDILLVFNNQRRAILAIEKGSPGERAFGEAFTAWGQ